MSAGRVICHQCRVPEDEHAERSPACPGEYWVWVQPGEEPSPGQELADLVAAVEQADSLEAAMEILRQHRPPATPMDLALLRERLRPILKRKGAASPARVFDAWLEQCAATPGEGLVGADPDPVSGDVAGAELLDEIRRVLGNYVWAEPEALDACTLWAAWTWVHDVFGVSPLLVVTSPSKRCGKTTLLACLRRLVRRPLATSNVTPAALFRVVEAQQPTLLVDEADSFLGLSDELRNLLNSGWTRDAAFVLRIEGERQREVRRFSTWAPKALAAIGQLPDTIADRAIRIRLRRKPPGSRLARAFEIGAVERDTHGLPARLARWAEAAALELRASDPPMPEELNDRDRENWRPLVAVADACGGHWPARARRAAVALCSEADEEETGVLLLRHARDAFDEKGWPEHLATEELLAALVARDDGPWAGWWAEAVEASRTKGPAAKLGRLLRPFGIRSVQLWIDGRNRRGYARSSFEPHWEAYALSEPPEDARDADNARPQVVPDQGSSVSSESSVFFGGPPDGAAGQEVE